MNPFEPYKDVKSAFKMSAKIYGAMKHPDGKDCVGEFRVRDNTSREWKIKVRATGNRGKYLKLKSKVGSREIRASANGYKPEKYARITPQEWSACAEYALGDESKRSEVMITLTRLI